MLNEGRCTFLEIINHLNDTPLESSLDGDVNIGIFEDGDKLVILLTAISAKELITIGCVDIGCCYKPYPC